MSKRPITAEDLYQMTWISDPTVNPINDRVAYVARTVKPDKSGYQSRIYTTDLQGSVNTAYTYGEQDTAPCWSPDGSKLAFIRKLEDKNQVWFMHASGGEAFPVTTAAEGVQSFSWSSDGKQLLYTSKVTTGADQGTSDHDQSDYKPSKAGIVYDRIRFRADGVGLLEPKRTHLFLYQLSSQETTALTQGDYDVTNYVWSPDGQQVAYTAKRPEDPTVNSDLIYTNDLFLVQLLDGKSHRLTNSQYSIGDMVFAPNSEVLAFVASDHSFGNATTTKLYTLCLANGEISCLMQEHDLLIANAAVTDMKMSSASKPVFSQDGLSIYAQVTIFGNVHIGRFGLDGSYEQVTTGNREVIQFTKTIHDREMVIVSADPLKPGELYLYNTETKAEYPLTHANDAISEQLELSEPETFWFQASDGEQIQGWIMKPAGAEPGQKVPTILEIHGGPHAMYANSFMHEFQLLASEGYAVIYCNPRGSHGYSQLFVNACRGDYGGRDYEDLMNLVDYAVEHYDYIDEQQLGVTGGSYGGFMTNWIVGQTNRFKTAVTQRSISNWISFYGVSDIGYYFTEDQIGGQPWEDLDKLWKHSPLAYVKQIETPLLILHGEEDYRCPIEQAEQLYVALKRLGKHTQLVRFPGSSHNLSRTGHPELRVERLNRIAGWMNQTFKVELQ